MRIFASGKTKSLVFVLALAVLLVAATTAASVWHHHATAAGEANCPICHLGHQPVAQPAVAHHSPVFRSVGSSPAPPQPVFVARPFAPRTPSRAPPAV